MRVRTLAEIPSSKGIIPAGQIIEIPLTVINMLKGKVEFSFLTKIVTATGSTVYVATDDKAAKLAPSGAALFTRQEIEAMEGIPCELAEKLITVKEVFNGAMVERYSEKEFF